MSLNISKKFLAPINERNERIATMTNEEKIEYIKNKYNLHHGKPRRKKKKKK